MMGGDEGTSPATLPQAVGATPHSYFSPSAVSLAPGTHLCSSFHFLALG